MPDRPQSPYVSTYTQPSIETRQSAPPPPANPTRDQPVAPRPPEVATLHVAPVVPVAYGVVPRWEDELEVVILQRSAFEEAPAVHSVPEPSVLALLLMGAAVWRWRR